MVHPRLVSAEAAVTFSPRRLAFPSLSNAIS
jgi:hypothetical protein